ncbi:hypothetical protein QF022_002438 [Vogesella perlucida]|nr:hypothetical protein [Vogesella perlucida]
MDKRFNLTLAISQELSCETCLNAVLIRSWVKMAPKLY